MDPITESKPVIADGGRSLTTSPLLDSAVIKQDIKSEVKPKSLLPDTGIEKRLSQPVVDQQAAAVENQIETDNPWQKFRSYFQKPTAAFQKFRDFFTLSINGLGIALNATAVLSQLVKGAPAKLVKKLDDSAEMFSRYIVPFSFLWNGVESLAGNRFIEAGVRAIPATLFWVLPFYNFNLATGLSSGLNYWLELANARNKDQIESSSPLANAKQTIKTVFAIMKDFLQGKKQGGESNLDIFSAFGMTIGAVGGLLFAHNERTSFAARLFGFLRNGSGMAGDIAFVKGDNIPVKRKKHIRRVGASCMTASVSNLVMRCVSEPVARILNHIAIAADDFGLTYWAHLSKVFNDEARLKNAGVA